MIRRRLSLEILFLQVLATQSEMINDPTLKPADPFSASADAEFLYKELRTDQHTDRDKVADRWFHRSYEQRIQISEFWLKNLSYLDLQFCLQDKSDDSLDDLYSDSFWSPPSLLGNIINEVIIGKWKEEGAIEQIVCGSEKDIKDRMDEYYKNVSKDTIENHLRTFTAEDQVYQQIMLQYCWKGLCQEKKITPEDADKEAKALRDINPDDDGEQFKNKLNELLDKNCEPDMKLIFQKYRQDDNGIEQAVEKAFKDNKTAERAYYRLVKYIEDTCKYYADELHNAVDDFGTDTDRINRIVLTRCERDLLCILKKYEEIHGETFTERLKSDTLGEGRYRKSIQFLCGRT